MTVLSTKTPNEEKPYTVDWTKALAAGDSIASAVWISPEGDLTFTNQAVPTSTTTNAVIGGGTLDVTGAFHTVKIVATTTQGDTLEQAFKLFIQQYNYL